MPMKVPSKIDVQGYVCVCGGVGILNHEYWQQRGVRMSNEKATLAAAAVPYPGLQGELVVLVEEKMCN